MRKKTDLIKCKEVYRSYYDVKPVPVDDEHVDHMYMIERREYIGMNLLDLTVDKNWERYKRTVEQDLYNIDNYEMLMSYINFNKKDIFLKDTLEYLSKKDLQKVLRDCFEIMDTGIKSTAFSQKEITELYKQCRNNKLIYQLDNEMYVYRAEMVGEPGGKEFGIDWYLNWVDCAYHKLLINWCDRKEIREGTCKIEDFPGVNMRDPSEIVIYRMKVKRDDVVAYVKIDGRVLVDYDVVQKTEKQEKVLEGDLL